MTLRHLMRDARVEVVAFNDLADPATLAHLVAHDSTQGAPDFTVASEGTSLILDGRRIPTFSEPDPARVPFGAAGARVVLECTGQAASRAWAAGHLRDGVSHVLVSAFLEDGDRTVVMGLNQGALDLARDRVISSGSGTTQALAPVVDVLDRTFGLEAGFVTAVHGFTARQRLLDLPHEDLRLARAASMSMIPTRTVAPRALAHALPRLEGRLEGLAVRVPAQAMGLLDLTATLRSDAPLEEVDRAFRREAGEGPLAPYLEVLPAELVGADLVGRTASALYDPFLTKALGPRMVKVFAWYDPECGYAARLKDLCIHILERLEP